MIDQCCLTLVHHNSSYSHAIKADTVSVTEFCVRQRNKELLKLFNYRNAHTYPGVNKAFGLAFKHDLKRFQADLVNCFRDVEENDQKGKINCILSAVMYNKSNILSGLLRISESTLQETYNRKIDMFFICYLLKRTACIDMLKKMDPIVMSHGVGSEILDTALYLFDSYYESHFAELNSLICKHAHSENILTWTCWDTGGWEYI